MISRSFLRKNKHILVYAVYRSSYTPHRTDQRSNLRHKLTLCEFAKSAGSATGAKAPVARAVISCGALVRSAVKPVAAAGVFIRRTQYAAVGKEAQMVRPLFLFAFLISATAGCGPVREWHPCQNTQCTTCRGTGSFRCTLCLGTGYAKCGGNPFIGGCDAGTTTCRTCNGVGMYLNRQCYNCNGRGRLNCTNCGGDGKASCRTCGGGGMAACGRWVVVRER